MYAFEYILGIIDAFRNCLAICGEKEELESTGNANVTGYYEGVTLPDFLPACYQFIKARHNVMKYEIELIAIISILHTLK